MKKIMLFLILVIVLLSACTPKGPGKADVLAQCLTAKGVVMYGTEWCPHCKEQKASFGSSFQYINYVDCDKYKEACSNAGVEGIPAWTIDDKLYSGTQSLYKLAKLSGCSLQ